MYVKYMIVILLIISYLPLDARIIYVPRDEQTIQDGIDSARESDTVLVAPGRYYENINFKGKHIMVASRFIIDKNQEYINKTIIDGSRYQDYDRASVVTFSGGEDENSVLTGLTLTGGKGTMLYWKGDAYRLGGGILVAKSGARIENNKIIANHLDDLRVAVCGSAGMEIFGNESVIVRNNEIRDNSTNGKICNGAVALWTSNHILFEDNLVTENISTGNQKSVGAGVSVFGEITVLGNLQGEIIIRRNIISNNQAISNMQANGGGLWIKNISPVLENNLIINNSASSGGGVFITHRPSCSGVTQPFFKNNSIVANSASTGGGVFIGYEERNTFDIKVAFHNTIIAGNQAIETGQELYTMELAKPTDFYYCNIPGGKNAFGGFGVGDDFTGALVHCTTGPVAFSTSGRCADHLDYTDYCGYYHLAEVDTVCVDKGDPETEFNDCLDPVCGTKPQWPSLGALRNDIGAYGGKNALKLDKTGVTTSIASSSRAMPEEYALEQNYPNPFNPETRIRFSIPYSEHVIIEVFNMLGQKVSVPINKNVPAGNHEFVFHPSHLPSGTYFYRFLTKNYQQVRKMVLLR